MAHSKEQLKQQMNLWRAGEIPLPTNYIELHRVAAFADLPRLLAKHKWRVILSKMTHDGWVDGMLVVHLVVSDEAEQWLNVRWSDSNGGSWFYRRLNGSGWTLIERAPTAPGYY